DLSKTRDHWFESLFYLLLSRRRDPCQGAAMKRILSRDDLEPPFLVAKLAGQLEQAFIGFTATVAEETFAWSQQAHQGLGQPSLGFVIVEIRGVDQAPRLLDQDLRDSRVRVAECADGDPAAEVQVPLSGDVPYVAAGSVAEHNIKPAVARHHVLIK